MSAIATAKRRRKQAANGYKHLAKLGRPVYKKVTKAKSAAKLRRVIEKQQAIAIRKGMKGKR